MLEETAFEYLFDLITRVITLEGIIFTCHSYLEKNIVRQENYYWLTVSFNWKKWKTCNIIS